MNWGLIVTNFIIAAIVGIRMKGEPTEWAWWATVVGFWATMGFRDYYVKGGF